MYSIEILSSALDDLENIADNVVFNLHNPALADKITNGILDAIDGLCLFPYRCPIYEEAEDLLHEYRKLIVKKYVVLYWVDDECQTVTVSHINYGSSEYGKYLRF